MEYTLDISNLLTSFGGAAGVLLVIKELYRLYMRTKQYDVKKVLEDERKIYFHLNNISEKTTCAKVLLLKLHNGGAEVRVGHPVFSTVTHEVASKKMPQQVGKWESRRVDEVYTQMLLEMQNSPERMLMTVTDEMKEGQLKDIYTAHKIKKSLICHVYTHRPKPFKIFTHFKEENMSVLWYISIPWSEDSAEEALTPSDRTIVRENREAIRKILSDAKKYD